MSAVLICDAELAALAAAHLAGMSAYREKEHWPIPSSHWLGQDPRTTAPSEWTNTIVEGLSKGFSVDMKLVSTALAQTNMKGQKFLENIATDDCDEKRS